MSIQVKICGITNFDDALDAVELGVDYLGFNFYPDSPRYVSPAMVESFLEELPSEIGRVGVFVNAHPQFVIDVATALNLQLIQFHGDENAAYCQLFARPFIKALRLKTENDLKGLDKFTCDYFLVDAGISNSYGGTGVTGNWDLARKVKNLGKPLFLAGGLTVDTVQMAISCVKPFAVDVASGVEESPGKKSYHKMEEFIKKVKASA